LMLKSPLCAKKLQNNRLIIARFTTPSHWTGFFIASMQHTI